MPLVALTAVRTECPDLTFIEFDVELRREAAYFCALYTEEYVPSPDHTPLLRMLIRKLLLPDTGVVLVYMDDLKCLQVYHSATTYEAVGHIVRKALKERAIRFVMENGQYRYTNECMAGAPLT